MHSNTKITTETTSVLTCNWLSYVCAFNVSSWQTDRHHLVCCCECCVYIYLSLSVFWDLTCHVRSAQQHQLQLLLLNITGQHYFNQEVKPSSECQNEPSRAVVIWWECSSVLTDVNGSEPTTGTELTDVNGSEPTTGTELSSYRKPTRRAFNVDIKRSHANCPTFPTDTAGCAPH